MCAAYVADATEAAAEIVEKNLEAIDQNHDGELDEGSAMEAERLLEAFSPELIEMAPERTVDLWLTADFVDPLKLMPKDEKAANLMRLKELKNGRLAMLAVIGIFSGYLTTGSAAIL